MTKHWATPHALDIVTSVVSDSDSFSNAIVDFTTYVIVNISMYVVDVK